MAAVVVVSTVTAGTGTAACIALGAAKGAISGAVSGAVGGAISGAVGGAVSHRIETGTWEGAGQAALNGAVQGAIDGAMSGAISGAITGAFTSPYCFVAGTAILTGAGYVAIENIKKGDLVWASNPDTGETAIKEVLQTYVNETDELIHVTIDGEEIVTTPSHPFYVSKQGWTDAIHLKAGDILLTVNGEYVVVEKVQHELLEAPIKVYNFEVADFHTYYVGEADVLVHNTCIRDGGGHGHTDHAKRINNMMDELEASGKYVELYGNRSLKTAGLNGTQRPDIIAKTKEGLYEIWEFASPSQATGTRGYKLLDAKVKLMQSNNPTVNIHDIIPW